MKLVMKRLMAPAWSQSKRQELVLHEIATQKMRKLFALLLAAAIDAGGTGLLLKLLSSRYASGNLRCTDLTTSICCSWAAKAMDQVMRDPCWLHVKPAVMKALLHKIGDCYELAQVGEDQLAQQLCKWALEG